MRILRDQHRLPHPEPLELVRVDHELLGASLGPAARLVAPVTTCAGALVGLERIFPALFRARHLRDELRRLGHILAAGEQDLDVSEHLVLEAVVDSPQVGDLLGREQERDPRRSGPLEEAGNVVGGDRRELVDGNDRGALSLWPVLERPADRLQVLATTLPTSFAVWG